MRGVSISVFAGVLDLLEQVHGPRKGSDEAVNEMIAKLGEVERLYKEQPVDPKQK